MNRCRGIFALLAFAVLTAHIARTQPIPASNTAPSYTSAGIVNAATGDAGALSPNAIASIYGTNLSWTTHAITAEDLNGGTLPTSLDGVTVYVNNMQSSLFYVSPTQINFLVPYDIVLTSATVFVERQGVVGPAVTIALSIASPGFFEWNGNFAVAEHADGSLISPSSPAQAGEIVVLYAAGLGRTSPDVPPGQIVSTATSILYQSELAILLNGSPCPASSIYYAGLTPGYAGLYQINLRLPGDVPSNPQIQMTLGSSASPAQVQLYVQ